MKIPATFTINGTVEELLIEPQWLLIEVLRDRMGLTGTKHSCGVGNCGACTVLVDGEAVLACLTLAVAARGKEITTIEGLAQGGKLHPLQDAFIEKGAIQCGYCTPGMILQAKAFLDKNPDPTEVEVRRALSGTICRCTGYVKIVEAVLAAAAVMRGEAGACSPATEAPSSPTAAAAADREEFPGGAALHGGDPGGATSSDRGRP